MKIPKATYKSGYDVIVVGAGPAGCSAAFFAAQAGARVLLLDKGEFPRDKVCGDGISPRALAVLDRIGVSEKIEDSSSFRINGVLVSSPNGTIMRSRIPMVDGFRNYGLVLPRKIFDQLLFDHVRRLENIDVLQPSAATDLLYEGEDICGVRATGGDGMIDIHGNTIIGADGVHSLVAKRLSLGNQEARYRAFGIRAYFDNVSGLKGCLEIHYDKAVLPGYAWVCPIGERQANVGVGVINRYTRSNGIKSLFQSFIKNSPVVRERLGSAKMIEDSLKGWPIAMGSFPGPRGKDNVVLIGDAGSMIDPLTGEGIYTALRSGELSAQALDLYREGRKESESFSKIYERLWKREFKWSEFKPGSFYQVLLCSKAFVNLAVSRAARNPKRAAVLAGAIIHLLPKRRLFFSM